MHALLCFAGVAGRGFMIYQQLIRLIKALYAPTLDRKSSSGSGRYQSRMQVE